MGANQFRPHVFVLPEDDANRQIANGFAKELSESVSRSMFILTEAGGWLAVLDQFARDQVTDMRRVTKRLMVLLIDFDNDTERLRRVKEKIPLDLADRVFVVGALGEPEDLKADLGSYESIGAALAQACRDNIDGHWAHDLLQHNAGELARLREHVRPILFP
jgi:hypothetical protein